jgi:hypothetical protein
MTIAVQRVLQVTAVLNAFQQAAAFNWGQGVSVQGLDSENAMTMINGFYE